MLSGSCCEIHSKKHHELGYKTDCEMVSGTFCEIDSKKDHELGMKLIVKW